MKTANLRDETYLDTSSLVNLTSSVADSSFTTWARCQLVLHATKSYSGFFE